MYVHHEACPRCGSRDNLARYDDGGGWCFGCHLHIKADRIPSSFKNEDCGVNEEKRSQPLPDDINHEYSQECIEWLSSFHVDVPTAIRNGLVWSPSYQQLIYQLGNCWQARNFNPERKAKRKNYTSGDVNECLFIYQSGEAMAGVGEELHGTVPLVIVEDPLSALRIGSLCPSLPLLGSHLAKSRLIAIAGLYSSLVVWLDSDKMKEAQGIADAGRLLGLSTRVIWTELDPKCYTDEQIKEYLS